MEDLDAVVIGAGVVGLATARALAQAGRDVVILEKADAFGTGTSSRNSEVIHAGLYYAPGWIKAQVCVAGRRRLYAYCGERGIPHRRCGKLVVATNATQAAMLDGIAAQARGHGVEELEILSGAAATAMEPQLSCIAALHSPVTGIVDSHALMLSLLGDAEAAGAILCVRTPVRHLAYEGGRIVLTCGDGDAAFTATARTLINAAGLGAPALAARLWGEGAAIPCPRGRMAKGNYFSLTGRAPFTRLVYPVPEPGGLGVHITVDLGGRARFGPDVEWVETETYAVDPARGEAFYGAIRRYWPALPDGALAPDTSGIRPKIVGPGEANADFLIADTAVHGVPGAIHLLGIESPGLTSCLALADLIAAKAG